MTRPSDTLAAALAPVAAEARRLARRRLRNAVTVTVARKLAAPAVFGGLLWVTFGAGPGPTPIPAWVLPIVIALLPVALGAAAASRIGTPTLYGAARALDARAGSHDLASTAVEFADETDGFRALAVEDGLARLRTHVALERETPLEPFPWTRWAGAVAFSALLAWLPPLGGRDVPTSTPPEADGKNDAARTTPTSASRPAAPRPTPASKPADAGKESRAMASVKKAGGEGGAGAGASGAGGGSKGDEAAGAGKAGTTAKASKAASAAGAGGSGATGGAGGESPPKAEPKRTPKAPPKPQPEAAKKPEDDGGASGGAARAGGRAAPSAERPREGETPDRPGGDDDAPDEDVDDDKEKSEQRGGVSPLRKDRPTPPARELSISGDGPPNDGRGGPTPPKKSRGTAALTLGVPLPDAVRGRPNPGTAKTSIGPTAPRTEPGTPGPAEAAGTVPAPTPQSALKPLGSLADAVKRHLDSLRALPQKGQP